MRTWWRELGAEPPETPEDAAGLAVEKKGTGQGPQATRRVAMRANRKMSALLGHNQGAAEVHVPSGFRLLIAGGFKEVDGCVFLREHFLGHDHATAIANFHDATGYEAAVNTIDLEQLLDAGAAREPAALALTGLEAARWLADRLREVPGAPFRVIFSVEGRHGTVRFHKIRDDEPPYLAADLDGYEEAVLELDTTDRIDTSDPTGTRCK